MRERDRDSGVTSDIALSSTPDVNVANESIASSASGSAATSPTTYEVASTCERAGDDERADVDSLKQLLQELMDLENDGDENSTDKLSRTMNRLKEVERCLATTRNEARTYQDMLEKSQNQYQQLEKKYSRAKKLVREFQQRELDMLHREEFYQQLLQEKDTEYNALVKNLKDRVICLEAELKNTQKKAGLPVKLPYGEGGTPQLTRRSCPAPMPMSSQSLELSDTETSDNEDGEKKNTVERKMPVKEELDSAVPQHQLLDNSASRGKAELAKLANRQLPSGKKSSGSMSNSSSVSDEA